MKLPQATPEISVKETEGNPDSYSPRANYTEGVEE